KRREYRLQRVDVGRLHEMMAKARRAGHEAVLRLSPAGERDEHDATRVGERTDTARYFISVHPRHAEVQEDGGRAERGERVEGSPPVVDAADLGAEKLQQRAKAVRRIAVVVDHQDARDTADL